VGLPHYVPVRQGYEVVKVRTKNGAGRTVARTARPIMFYAQTAKSIKIRCEQYVNFLTPFPEGNISMTWPGRKTR